MKKIDINVYKIRVNSFIKIGKQYKAQNSFENFEFLIQKIGKIIKKNKLLNNYLVVMR